MSFNWISHTFTGRWTPDELFVETDAFEVVCIYRCSPYNRWSERWNDSRAIMVSRNCTSIPSVVREKRDEIDRVLANPLAYEYSRAAVIVLASLKQMHTDGDHAIAHRVWTFLIHT